MDILIGEVGYMRYSYGYSDWRGIVGSKGEASPMLASTRSKAK